MNKILIIGSCGSGKSHLAKELSKIFNINVFHIDNIYWNKNKESITDFELKHKLLKIIETDKWIIDGDYLFCIEDRINSCDTIFYLDYSIRDCLNGIKTRIYKNREDIPFKEDQNDLIEMERYLINTYNSKRQERYKLLKQHPDKKVYVLRNRIETNNLIKILTKKKGDVSRETFNTRNYI